MQLNRPIKNDTWCRCINLRANNFDSEALGEIFDAFKDNVSIFNLDLRQNPGLS